MLWSNNNLSTGFQAQTVTFKENTYSHYIIKFYGRNDLRANVPTVVLIDTNHTTGTGYFKDFCAGCYYQAGGGSLSRIISKTTNNSVTFGGAEKQADTYMVPFEIYGVNIEF